MLAIFFEVDQIVDEIDDAGNYAEQNERECRGRKHRVHFIREGLPVLAQGEHERQIDDKVLGPLTRAHGLEQIQQHNVLQITVIIFGTSNKSNRNLTSVIWNDLTFSFLAFILLRVAKKRLDVLLVERELVETRQRAQALILAGDVQVNGSVVSKAGMPVAEDAAITIRAPLKYVSRGGLKLEAALDAFAVDPRDKVCADIGASTGGFTDCLLQRGAARVYAIDVGYGQLAWKIRNDPRVVVMDRVNIRHLAALPELVDLVTIDVSFISLLLVFPVAKRLLKSRSQVIALIKPQFEAGREQVGKGGIVRDARVHRAVIEKIARAAIDDAWRVLGLYRSPIQGADGNVEFLIHLSAYPNNPEARKAIKPQAKCRKAI